MIYRGSGLLEVVGLAPPPPLPSLSRQQVVFLSQSAYVSPVELFDQRWASTLANRSNARHRSNIIAPPPPSPPNLCIQTVGICVARGAGRDS
jgi:hypothetical protein